MLVKSVFTCKYTILTKMIITLTGVYTIYPHTKTYTLTYTDILCGNAPLSFTVTCSVVDGETMYAGSNIIYVDYTIPLEETFNGQQPFIDGSEHHGLIQSIINIINYIHVMIRKVI